MNSPAASATGQRLPLSLDGWVGHFQGMDWPVLDRTAQALEEMRDQEDAVDARMLADIMVSDPLMTLKLLAHTSALNRSRRTTDVETVREALVLIGITPFFRAFGPQPTIEQALADQPEALAGLQDVIRRAERAAHFALGFAVHRADQDAQVIHEAALLHDFVDMLLWLRAPSLALEIRRRQRADPTLRSVAVQRQLLGTSLSEIQHALMLAWRLPDLLVQITDDRHEESTQVRNVLLAIRVARHSADGWDNPALPDDIRDIAQLLNLSLGPARSLLEDLDG
jgi:HD-like signal output (HDOD) protein